jgi:hypothetical protein
MESGHAANNGGIVSETTITMDFTELREETLNVIEGLWPLGVTGQFCFLPRGLRPFHIFLQHADTLLQLCELTAGIIILSSGCFEDSYFLLDPL